MSISLHAIDGISISYCTIVTVTTLENVRKFNSNFHSKLGLITKIHVVSRFLCGGLHAISAVCRDIGSSEFDYAAPGAILI